MMDEETKKSIYNNIHSLSANIKKRRRTQMNRKCEAGCGWDSVLRLELELLKLLKLLELLELLEVADNDVRRGGDRCR